MADIVVIEDSSYGEARERLAKDPIVLEMVRQIPVDWYQWLQDVGYVWKGEDSKLHPKSNFMNMCNRTYREMGGQDGAHIGAIAEAVLTLLEQRREQASVETREKKQEILGYLRRRGVTVSPDLANRLTEMDLSTLLAAVEIALRA